VADYYKSETAKAAFENADWMFLLRQKPESIEMLANSGKFIMDDYTKTLLRSVTTQSGAFAEVFVRGGDLPPSVGRLFADPFAILTASSKADDFEAVRRFTSQGMSTERAIEAVLEQRAAKRSSSQRATS
jgi:conjugal transfer ATP-binding protein TraC